MSLGRPQQRSPGRGAAAGDGGSPRRVSEEAARGLPMLISFVNRTQAIYQLRLADAVDVLDAQRERRNQCITAAAVAVSD